MASLRKIFSKIAIAVVSCVFAFHAFAQESSAAQPPANANTGKTETKAAKTAVKKTAVKKNGKKKAAAKPAVSAEDIIPSNKPEKSDLKEQYALSRERIETINAIVEEFVHNREKMDDPIVQYNIMKAIEAKMPLTPEADPIVADLAEINRQAKVVANKKYPENATEQTKKLEEEAAKKYPLAQLKSVVTLKYRSGPFIETTTGVLHKVGPNYIQVGDKRISFIDMNLDTRMFYDAKLNEEQRQKYIKDNFSDQAAQHAKLQQAIFINLLHAQFQENEKNGYIYLEKKETWTTAKAIARTLIEREATAYKKRAAAKAAKEAARAAKEAAEAEKKKQEQEVAEKAAQKAAEAEKKVQTTDDTPVNESAFRANLSGQPEGDIQDDANRADLASQESEDILKGDESQLTGTGSTDFIAMSAEEISDRLSKIQVDPTAYNEMMVKVDKMIDEINHKYFGIDADQGFKKALWGFSDRDVHYVLSREREAAFKKHLVINRNDIIYPPNSRPARILLHYRKNALYKVDIFMGNLNGADFKIYTNSLQNKYGRSTTQRTVPDKDLFALIASGEITPKDIPNVIAPVPEKEDVKKEKAKPEKDAKTADAAAAKDGKPAEADAAKKADASKKPNKADLAKIKAQEEAEALRKPYIFVWEGEISRGILSFVYDREEKLYKNVRFEKIYLPEKAAAAKKAEAAKAAEEKAAKENAESAKQPDANAPKADADAAKDNKPAPAESK